MKFYLTISALLIIENIAGQHVFQYDQQGRLTSDPMEEIAEIEWNNMNRITRITRTSSSNKPDLEFSYDALGNRVRKMIKPRAQGKLQPADTWECYYYQNKNDDAILAIYHSNFKKKSSSSYTQTINKHYQQLVSENQLGIEQGDKRDEVTRSFKAQISDQGTFQNIEEAWLLIPSLTAVSFTNRSFKAYELINHERNVNVVLSDRRMSQPENQTRAEVVSVTDHYPFGMIMPGRFNDIVFTSYPFGFGGKEKQREINSVGNIYDYGARIYEARLARWVSIDKLYEKYPSTSPYVYGLNSPVSLIDTDGNQVKKSARFENTYGKYYEVLMKTDGYQAILKDFLGNSKRRYLLDISNKEVEELNKNYFGFNRSSHNRVNEIVESRSVFKSNEPINKMTVQKHHGLTFTKTIIAYSEIFIVYSMIHEATHALEDVQAAPYLLGEDDKNSHEMFNRNRNLIINALRDYAYAANLYYTQSQLEDLAWHGTTESLQFKEHFEAESKKNSTSYNEEVQKWQIRVNKIIFKETHGVKPSSQYTENAK